MKPFTDPQHSEILIEKFILNFSKMKIGKKLSLKAPALRVVYYFSSNKTFSLSCTRGIIWSLIPCFESHLRGYNAVILSFVVFSPRILPECSGLEKVALVTKINWKKLARCMVWPLLAFVGCAACSWSFIWKHNQVLCFHQAGRSHLSLLPETGRLLAKKKFLKPTDQIAAALSYTDDGTLRRILQKQVLSFLQAVLSISASKLSKNRPNLP